MLIDCPKCGRTGVEANGIDMHLCRRCADAESKRITYYKKSNSDWLEIAKESGVDEWLQQPGESQWEYSVWCAFRDSYPGKRPTYQAVALQMQTTHSVVKGIASRWTFPVRMQLWMQHVDAITLTQRHQEILDMNKQHIDMAKRLNDKISKSIDSIDPYGLKPSELNSLMKTAAELERKARLDVISQESQMAEEITGVASGAVAKKTEKQQTDEDMKEIVDILAKAGVLDGITIEKTTKVTVNEPAIEMGEIDG